MILVADSGSTRTDWCFVSNKGEKICFHSIGMNPYNISFEQIEEEMKRTVMPFLKDASVKFLYFYGSGCSAESKKKFMHSALSEFFPKAFIEIEHDLLGAARALCGKGTGIAAILGTGSNSCLYDGNDILENVLSLGYVLCDEGAGTYIGKLLITSYLRNEFPPDLHENFQKQYPGNESDFLDHLYKKPFPNRFLASFSPFARENKDHPFVAGLLDIAFSAFFEKQVMKYTCYQKYKVNFVGSISYYFKENIAKTAAKYNLQIGKIIKDPLDNLVEYHLIN